MSKTASVQNSILERVASAAAYLPLAGRLVVLLLPTRNSRHVRFHLIQSSLFGFASFVTGAGALTCSRIYPIVLTIFIGGDVAVLLTLATGALIAKPLTLPGLGPLAHKLAALEPGWLKRRLHPTGCLAVVSCDTTPSGGE